MILSDAASASTKKHLMFDAIFPPVGSRLDDEGEDDDDEDNDDDDDDDDG